MEMTAPRFDLEANCRGSRDVFTFGLTWTKTLCHPTDEWENEKGISPVGTGMTTALLECISNSAFT